MTPTHPLPAHPLPGAGRLGATRRAAALAVALLAAAASAPGRAAAQAPHAGHAPAPAGAPALGRAPADTAVVARVRADSAKLPYTEADVRFMTDMIHHHAQAITMSRLAASHEASPAVRTLADRIVNAQRDEIGVMQQWLRDRGRPVPEVGDDGTVRTTAGAPSAAGAHAAGHQGAGQHAAGDHAQHHAASSTASAAAGHDHAQMPGMLTAEQLRALDAARGPRFDELFLESMIRHHRGATSMVQQLFAAPGAGQDWTVFKFAADVNVDQTTEIQRMERMLVALMFQRPAAAPAPARAPSGAR